MCLVVVVNSHDGGAGPDNAVPTEAEIRVRRDAANNYDDPARSEERQAGLDDGANTADLHHRVVLEVRQDGLLGSKLDSLLPPGRDWVTDVDLQSVLFEESTAVQAEQAGTEYENPPLSSPPGEAVLAGCGPGSHHGGEGAVDRRGESHVQGRGQRDHRRAPPQQDVGGVAAQGDLARPLSAVAVLAQPETFLLRSLPAQLAVSTDIRHREGHPLPPAQSRPATLQDGAAALVAQH